MSQKLEQQQTEQQVLSLNALQVALARVIELPLADLSERIQNEMLDNGALEEKDGEPDDYAPEESAEDVYSDDEPTTDDAEVYAPEAPQSGDEMADYLTADDVPSYLQERADNSREAFEVPVTGTTSFYDGLQQQVAELGLSEEEEILMDYLIGSLDTDGFLRKELYTLCDELYIYQNIDTTEEQLGRLLGMLQTFEPTGIGARSLQECLQLQLRNAEFSSPHKAKALEAVTKYYKDFSTKHWDALQRKLKLGDAEFEGVLQTLLHLNPKPGSAFNESAAVSAPTIVPDFFVEVIDGDIRVQLNHDGVPELRVSPAFRDTMRQYGGRGKTLTKEQQDAYTYVRQKVESAQQFINILQRRNDTLLGVMRTIVALQEDFFLQDDEEAALRPMTLRDVAERVGVDISTVSRVTSSKYVQTIYGVYPLKYFFSNQITTDEGEELASRLVKSKLRELIDGEDKSRPFSDDALSGLLKEKGFPIARRTVAKYRDQMGIPTARLRK